MDHEAKAPAASAVARVPGKLILMGEHAVVYGRPALVATVGLRVTVQATREPESGAPGVLLDLRDLEHRERALWPDLVDYADRARRAWERYSENPSPERFADVETGDPAHLVKVALGELACEAAGRGTAGALPPVSLRIESELPLGSGFGSSAATAVGVLAAGMALLGGATDLPTLDRLALEVERRQHGMPSGADHNTVLRGGVLQILRDSSGALTLEPVQVSRETLERFSIFHTGAPAESTGEVVAAVRQRRSEDPATFERLLDRMGGSVVAFTDELTRPRPDATRLAELVRDYERCLERLGVVPESVRQRLTEAAAQGVIGKISGAGSLSEGGAGSLLVFGEMLGGAPAALSNYTPYPARLGVPGLELEVEN
jgi:mevalonate kinase